MTVVSKSPQIKICDSSDAAASAVASIFAAAIGQQSQSTDRDLVLGLATGGTPIRVYRKLVEMHDNDRLDFSAVTTFNLDEYVGLPGDHPQSYRYFMQQQLFDHINVDLHRTHVPDGTAADLATAACDYEGRIRQAGGIDLQLLGIGSNGHIAFNEPGSAADSRTRVVDLTSETIEANARFFDSPDQVPRKAITMGIGTILEARQIVLMATGSKKADAVYRALHGPVTTENPASLLRQHSQVVFVLDREAAARLPS